MVFFRKMASLAAFTRPDSAVAYTVWRQSELPEEWKRPIAASVAAHVAALYEVHPDRLRSRVCCELPDFGWARQYRDWHIDHHGQDSSCVDIMLTPLAEFRGEANAVTRGQLAAEQLRSILSTGRPGPMFTRIFDTNWEIMGESR